MTVCRKATKQNSSFEASGILLWTEWQQNKSWIGVNNISKLYWSIYQQVWIHSIVFHDMVLAFIAYKANKFCYARQAFMASRLVAKPVVLKG